MELKGRGRYRRGLIMQLRREGIVPQYPGPKVVPPVRVPPAPVLRDEHTRAVRLELVVRAYRTVVELVTGKPCRVLARAGQVQGYRHAGQLAEAATVMVEKELPPLMWAHWRVCYWYRKDPARKLPPLTWVYKLEPLRRMRWMFLREYNEQLTGVHERTTPAHDDLRLRWRLMDETLRRVLPDASGELVELARAIVDDFFPDGLYASLVEQARAQVETEQAQLHRRARRGEWLWSLETSGCKTRNDSTD